MKGGWRDFRLFSLMGAAACFIGMVNQVSYFFFHFKQNTTFNSPVEALTNLLILLVFLLLFILICRYDEQRHPKS